jgi:hypothetical protein
LYPGAAPRSIPVTLANPNRVAIFMTSLVTVAASTPAGCNAATNLRLVQSDASSARAVRVAAGGSVTLPASGVSAPAIGLADLPLNLDACKNAKFDLRFTGSAGS